MRVRQQGNLANTRGYMQHDTASGNGQHSGRRRKTLGSIPEVGECLQPAPIHLMRLLNPQRSITSTFVRMGSYVIDWENKW